MYVQSSQGWKSHPKRPLEGEASFTEKVCLRVQKKFSVLTGGGIQMTTWTEAKDPDKARDSGPPGSHWLIVANRISNGSCRLTMEQWEGGYNELSQLGPRRNSAVKAFLLSHEDTFLLLVSPFLPRQASAGGNLGPLSPLLAIHCHQQSPEVCCP